MTKTKTNVAGANAGRSRAHNRRVVLGHMRREGTIGRAELGRRTGLSTQAMSNIIADLERDGLIEATGTRSVGRGLPAVQYSLRPHGAFALGFEIRPDAVFVTVLGLDGQEYYFERCAIASALPDPVCATLTRLRDNAVTHAGIAPDRLLGAGVVMPGPFGETGVSGKGTELLGWQDINVVDRISTTLGLPTFVENDANAAAMAERVAGAARHLQNYLFLYFGSGLGLGIISNGRLERGGRGNAGEIGHIPVMVNGQAAALEDVVSRLSLRTHLAQSGHRVDESSDLEALFDARDPALMAWLDQASQALSSAILILENLFDPEAVFLGGAMPNGLLDHMIDLVRLPQRSVANRPGRDTDRLLRGGSGRMTATRGAASLVINQTFTPQFETAAE